MRKIEIGGGSLDITPGSVFRNLLEKYLGSNWVEYRSVCLERMPNSGIFVTIHNSEGPATEKLDGTQEWWIYGEKLFVKTQQEFECYLRNKVFW